MDTIAGNFPKRNVFNLTHDRKMTLDMGKLVPCLVEEAIPGDTWFIEPKFLLRLSPQTVPWMHIVNVCLHYFFVPMRLLWDKWADFITGGTDGADATTPPFRTLAAGSNTVGSLLDYMGIPSGTDIDNKGFSTLPFRAYNLIYDEWFRDQNWQTAKLTAAIKAQNGQENGGNETPLTLLSRNWEKDYFTSALAWAQRGTEITTPLGSTAPIINAYVHENDVDGNRLQANNAGLATVYLNNNVTAGQNENLVVEGDVDLSAATAASINDLRAAFQLQRWAERNARAGVRLVEFTLAHFGVRPPDYRMQRPELIGGSKTPITISEVLQTSETAGTPQGNMAGHGYAVSYSGKVKYSVAEHGYIIGIMSVMPRTAYQQGLPRKFSRETRYDFYFPEFANLGEQAIKKKEIYYATDGDNENVFGYQGRYDEFRRRESSVHGDMKTTMDDWHMGRIFGARPTLGSSFITCDPSTRSFAVPAVQQCIVQLLTEIKAIRPIPILGEPGLIDHG